MPEGDIEQSDKESEDDEADLPWMPKPDNLPEDLKFILKKVNNNERMDCKRFFEGIAVYKDLRTQPFQNNHRGDAHNQVDKLLKNLESKGWNILRSMALLHTVLAEGPPEVVACSQQLWMYTAGTVQGINRERKKRSIPGTVSGPNEDNLFTKEDLASENA